MYAILKIEPDKAKHCAGKDQLVNRRTVVDAVDLIIILILPCLRQRPYSRRYHRALWRLDQAGDILCEEKRSERCKAIGQYTDNNEAIKDAGNIEDKSASPDKGYQDNDLAVKS